MLQPFPETCAEHYRRELEVVPLLASTGSANDKQKQRFDPLPFAGWMLFTAGLGVAYFYHVTIPVEGAVDIMERALNH